MRIWLTNTCLLACVVALLVQFGLIVRYEGYYLQEPNVAILVVEIVFLLSMGGLAIANFITDGRKIRRGE